MMTPEQDDHGGDDDKATLIVTSSSVPAKRGRFSFFRRGGGTVTESEPLTTTKSDESAHENAQAVLLSCGSSDSSEEESFDSGQEESECDEESKEHDSDEEEEKDTGTVKSKEPDVFNESAAQKDVIEEKGEDMKVVPFVAPQLARLNPPTSPVQEKPPPGRFWSFRRRPKEQNESLLDNCEDLDQKAHGPKPQETESTMPALETEKESPSLPHLEGFGSHTDSQQQQQHQQRSNRLLSSFQLGRLMARSRSDVNPLNEEEKRELEQKMAESQQLKQMKIKTEPTKDDKDWKEKASNTIAKVLVPEIYFEEENGEGNLGRYRTVRMDIDEEEEEDEKESDEKEEEMTQGQFLSRHVQMLEAKISELRAQLMIKDLEALGWKQRAKELEREVRALRRGDCDTSARSVDSSDKEEEATDDEAEDRAKEGNLLGLLEASNACQRSAGRENKVDITKTANLLVSAGTSCTDHENVSNANLLKLGSAEDRAVSNSTCSPKNANETSQEHSKTLIDVLTTKDSTTELPQNCANAKDTIESDRTASPRDVLLDLDGNAEESTTEVQGLLSFDRDTEKVKLVSSPNDAPLDKLVEIRKNLDSKLLPFEDDDQEAPVESEEKDMERTSLLAC